MPSTFPLFIASQPRVVAQALGPRIPPLPSPPLHKSALFEQPWAVVVVLMLGAIAALFIFNGRGQARRGALVAGGLVLSAAALWGLAAAVVTPRERLKAATHELVDATAVADIAKLEQLLAPNVRAFHSGAPRGMERDEILRWVTQRLGASGEYAVKNYKVPEVQAALDGRRVGRTQVRVVVVVTHALGEAPVDTWWRVDWNLGDDGTWRTVGIRPLAVGGRSDP